MQKESYVKPCKIFLTYLALFFNDKYLENNIHEFMTLCIIKKLLYYILHKPVLTGFIFLPRANPSFRLVIGSKVLRIVAVVGPINNFLTG